MRCQNCGTENQDGKFCMSCGNPLVYTEMYLKKPPTLTMALALISFAVFFYLGLPATLLMIFSRDAFNMGDFTKFRRYDKYSKICSIIGIVLFAILMILYLVFMFIIIMEDASRL